MGEIDWSKLTPEERKKMKKKLKRKKQKAKKKAAKLAAANAKKDTALKQLNVTKIVETDADSNNNVDDSKKKKNDTDGTMDALTNAVDNMKLKGNDQINGSNAKKENTVAVKLNSEKPYVHNLYSPNFNLGSCGTGEPVSFEWNKMSISPSEWTDPIKSKSCTVFFITSYGTLVKALGLPTELALSTEDNTDDKTASDERSWYLCAQHREDVSPTNKARFAVRCVGEDNNHTLRQFRKSCGIDTIDYSDYEDNEEEDGDDENNDGEDKEALVEDEEGDVDDDEEGGLLDEDEDPELIWKVTFDASYALVVLSFLEHKCDDLVFLRYKKVMNDVRDVVVPTNN